MTFEATPDSILYVITGDNCAACRTLKPTLVDICEAMSLELVELPTKDNMGLVRSLGIRSVPCVVYKGKVVFSGSWNRGPAEKLISAAMDVE